MKTNSRARPWTAALLITAASLLLGACLEKHIVWSPDGKRAAIIGRSGLRLGDANGRIVGELVPDVKLAAWLPDSERLVLVRAREASAWATIGPALGAARPVIEKQAAELWRQLEAGAMWSVVNMDLGGRKGVVKICLRDTHREQLKAKLSASEWNELEQQNESLRELVVARVVADRVEVGPVLQTQFGDIGDVRVAPGGAFIAWTTERPIDKDEFDLLVAPVSGPAAATTVARRTSAFPDWSADGRSLVYVEAPRGQGEQPEDAIVVGVVTRRGVLDEQGRVALADKPEYLAGLFSNTFTHVRCLRDGRVLFNAAEMTLPMAAADYGGDQREQLFAIDPTRQSTLVRLIPRRQESNLPQGLAFFEVSPDERQVVFGGTNNEVAVLTLATGEVKSLQEGAKDTFQGLPVWRRAGELTYVKRTEAKDGAKPARRVEVVCRVGDKEEVLSRTWSDDVLDDVTHMNR